jgi:hypothetical protein
MLQDLRESREESVGPGESHASSSVVLISFEILVITTNEAMRAERREFVRKFASPVSPTLQAIGHAKTGWIESRDPSISRASKRTSSTFRVFSGCYLCINYKPEKE